MNWRLSHRADAEARVLADRHYSRQHVGATGFVAPGRCVVLKCEGAYWVTSWPLPEFVKHEWAGAWVCSAFRREPDCPWLASTLIGEAVAATCAVFGAPPSPGMVTFVDTTKVRHKRDVGRCFRRAGFVPCGWTKGGLLTLHLRPEAMPAPCWPQPQAPLAQLLLWDALP